MSFDPDAFLKSLQSPDKKLCFYPSSGTSGLWSVMSLAADIFVFAEKSGANSQARRKSTWEKIVADFEARGVPLELVKATAGSLLFKTGDKWGFFFFAENNAVLARIAATGWRIDTFVGIRDGCAEGDNHECVHDRPFLDKLLAVAAPRMNYFTDHSMLLKCVLRGEKYILRKCYGETCEFLLQEVLVLPSKNPEGIPSGARKSERPPPEAFAAFIPATSPKGTRTLVPFGDAVSEVLKLTFFRSRPHLHVDRIARYEVILNHPANAA